MPTTRASRTVVKPVPKAVLARVSANNTTDSPCRTDTAQVEQRQAAPPPQAGREPSDPQAGAGSARRSPSASNRAESERRSLSVRFKDNGASIVEVPEDQEDPVDVWNVYSPVRYVSRKEQRVLEGQSRLRTAEIVEYCAGLFESSKIDRYMREKKENAEKRAGAASKPLSKSTNGQCDGNKDRKNKEQAVAASFIMSMWPGFPVDARPSMSIEVEAALPHLYKGTHLCIFNEENDHPLRCTAALRLLRNADGDEGSVAIYNRPELTFIDGYIPLCFLFSLTRGLEDIERQRYVSGDIVKCKTENGEILTVSYKRAFTLHCRAPQRFYVSFIAINDADLDKWMRVLSYFAYQNSQCRAYYANQPAV